MVQQDARCGRIQSRLGQAEAEHCAMSEFEQTNSIPRSRSSSRPQWRGPVLFNSPHCGSVYPRAFLAASRLDVATLRRSEDTFVDELALAWWRAAIR